MSDYRIEWDELVALTPSADEVARFADALATGYNHPANAALLGNTEHLSRTDVIDYYTRMRAEQAAAFVFLASGELAGDGDLRNVRGDAAEFAFLIAAPSAQGKGLGTRFATMLHVFAFEQLALATVYASIVPANHASLRVFEKLGYAVDASPAARAFAEDPADIVLALDRESFRARHGEAMAGIRVVVR